jgi:hypothetical protein
MSESEPAQTEALLMLLLSTNYNYSEQKIASVCLAKGHLVVR